MKDPGFEIPQMTFEVRKIIGYPPKKTPRGYCHFSIHFQLPRGIPYQEIPFQKIRKAHTRISTSFTQFFPSMKPSGSE